jgi:rubrerythrin
MLQRKTPLQAKTGFKKRGGKLRAFSVKGKQRNESYRKVRQEYLEEKDYACEVCGMYSTDIHHKKGRGKNLCKKESFMAVCRSCHLSIHHNVALATEKGYIIRDYT